jgi:plant G-box-binding factor
MSFPLVNEDGKPLVSCNTPFTDVLLVSWFFFANFCPALLMASVCYSLGAEATFGATIYPICAEFVKFNAMAWFLLTCKLPAAPCCALQTKQQIKRLRRQQSNRESARRSRQRKAEEANMLARRVGDLEVTCGTMQAKNATLAAEVQQLRGIIDMMASDSSALAAQVCGKEVLRHGGMLVGSAGVFV